MDSSPPRRSPLIIAIILLTLVIATRWTLAPKYLFYFDNINFALALDHFNPAKHQPQPPGYPLFVGLEQLIHTVIPSVKYTQLTAGAIGSALALLAIWYLGNLLFGAPAGLLATALLLFNPVFWIAGIGNHVRTFLTAMPIVLSICVWQAWRSEAVGRWFVYSGVALGIAAGFRPELLLLLAPLWASTMLRRKLSLAAKAAGVAALVAAILPWLVAMALKSGGWHPMTESFDSYFRYHTSDTSFFFGGAPARSMKVAVLAVYWTGLGALTWIWAVPFARLRSHAFGLREEFIFLAAWFVPPFVFHTLIHSDEPDHVLDVVPVVCLAGGLVLSLFHRAHGRFSIPVLATLVALLNAFVFFVPLNPPGKEASYRWVREVGDDMTASVDGLRSLPDPGPFEVILYKRLTTAHQLAYYFPQDKFFTLDPACPASVKLPAASRVAILQGGALKQKGPFLLADPPPHEFRLGACRITLGAP